jgi:hypothetical protein
MGTSADLLDFIARSHGKDDPPAVHLYNLRLRRYLLPERSRREVADVDGRADGALAGFKIFADGVSAAFSIARIMMGVASTGGSIASLNRLARCSGLTTSVKLPLARGGIACMSYLFDTFDAGYLIYRM